VSRALATRWAARVQPDCPLPDYPRPQLARAEWLPLNGPWEFAPARPGERPPVGRRLAGRVLVPFPVESALSGVGRGYERMWYRRSFSVPRGWAGRRVHLRFGAVDWEAAVWVNGVPVGSHRGGYDPFGFDVTDCLRRGAEELVVGVFDPTDGGRQPLGKQRRQPGGIFYTPSSGIWQTVWLEPTPSVHVTGLVVTPDAAGGRLRVRVRAAGSAAAPQVRVEVRDDATDPAGETSRPVAAASGLAGETLELPVPSPRLWSPSDPHLYGVRATLLDGRTPVDEVRGYAGLRSIEVAEVRGVSRPLLNGRFLFHLGALDQGYWPDGGLTAPTDAALRSDLDVLKDLGYTCVRKHVKVEPARWYHWADRLGLLVWQDMPSMPHDRVPDAAARRQFETELTAMVEHLRPFPSVVAWVPFNEGWGQYDVGAIARLVRELDPTRLVSENSGAADPGNDWTDAGAGQWADMHTYPDPLAVPPSHGRAAALGEYGGLGLGVTGHTLRPDRSWSYEHLPSAGALTDRYVAMIDRLAELVRSSGLSAAVYTQMTDVEDELNGLLTYDRALLKPDAEAVRAAHARLLAAAERAAG
jgi:beta-galactosidase/beta-glucuronidase